MSRHRSLVLLVALGLGLALAAQTPPPKPPKHVADKAGVLSAATVAELVAQLEKFESETSSQVVVWTERTLPANAALEDYVNRVFQAWKIGQRSKDNGVLLAIFTQDRKLRIEVGYGLEGALPDALCGRIIADEITPRFKQGDYDAGIRAGVNAILAATKGEYQVSRSPGGGRALSFSSDRALLPLVVFGGLLGFAGGFWRGRAGTGIGMVGNGVRGGFIGGLGHPFAYVLGSSVGWPIGLFVLLFVWAAILSKRRGWHYDHGGSHTGWSGWSSGGWSSGGGGFSGGGGSSGGGGASGSW